MFDETLCTYERHKKEAKSILKRITKRQHQEIQKERSEGFEIVDDLKEELRKTYRRTMTEKINKAIRRKKMTEHYKQTKNQQSLQTQRFTCRQPTIQLTSRGICFSKNNVAIKTRSNSRKLSFIQQSQLNEVLLQVQDSLKESTSDKESQAIYKNQELDELQLRGKKDDDNTQKSGIWSKVALADQKSKKTFLPLLELYVQQRLFLKNMSKQQQRTHNIITQMLLLALARRNNRKLLDSLDILISIDSFFPKQNSHMQHLKTVWYLLIATVFLQIKQSQKKDKENRWRRDSKRSSIKAKAQMKRQKTIIIRTLASKKNFLDRVSLQLQKMDLVHQTSYQKQIDNYRNTAQQGQQGKFVVSRVSQNYLLAYPEPSALFPEVQDIQNYSILIINRDQESNLFPNHYPVVISDILGQQEYVSILCKINSILVPQTRCFSYQSSMQVHFQSVLIICLLLLVGVVVISTLLDKELQSQSVIGINLIVFALVIFFSLKIHMRSSKGSGQSNIIFSKIKKILEEISQQYQRYSIKFSLSQTIDIIIISFPKNPEAQSASSEEQVQRSEGYLQTSSKLKTFKCSLNDHYLNQITQIMEKNDSETQNERYLAFKTVQDRLAYQVIQDQTQKQSKENKQQEDRNEDQLALQTHGIINQLPPLLINEYQSEAEQQI